MISPDLLEILACPVCRKPLVLRGEDALKCIECKRVYPIRNDIPILLELTKPRSNKSDTPRQERSGNRHGRITE